MDLPRGYISYNQIRLYQSCPKKYYYTYVEKIPVPLNDKVFLGIVFHAVVEYYFKEKISNKEPGKENLIEQFDQEFIKLSKNQNIIWEISIEKTRARGIAFIQYFLREIAPAIEHLMIEKEMLVELPALAVPLKGVLDLVETDFSITDFKTTTTKWTKTRIRSAYLQVVIYRYLFEKNFGSVISQLKFKILYAKESDNIKHQEIDINARDLDNDYKQMFTVIKYVVDNIRQEVFYKNENYSCGFCDFKHVCQLQNKVETGT